MFELLKEIHKNTYDNDTLRIGLFLRCVNKGFLPIYVKYIC